MSLYNFNYVSGEGLKAQINKPELEKLMDECADNFIAEIEQEKREDARLEDLEQEEERTDEQQGYKDTGMRPSDFM